jgi:hypothetical protein
MNQESVRSYDIEKRGAMSDDRTEPTRRALHAVAELVLAGPQHRASNTVRLRVIAGGFATIAAPDVRVVGTDLVCADRRVPIDGQTPRSLAEAIGVDAGGPIDLYHDGSGASIDDRLALDAAAAEQIFSAYTIGDAALRLLAPQVEPVLWPEHFDVGIRVDDVNFGVSPGDAHHAEPYAYVGVDPVPEDAFWNAPFGVVRPMTAVGTVEELHAFLAEGRSRWDAPKTWRD